MLLRIKLLRIMKEQSQWELSKAAGLHQSKYSLIERGLVEPTEKERERLARPFRPRRPTYSVQSHAYCSNQHGARVESFEVRYPQ